MYALSMSIKPPRWYYGPDRLCVRVCRGWLSDYFEYIKMYSLKAIYISSCDFCHKITELYTNFIYSCLCS